MATHGRTGLSHALMIFTDRGLILITGFAHPEIVHILQSAEKIIEDKILLLMGGLVLGKQPQIRTLLSESLWYDGCLAESVGDAAMLWEHLGNTQPDLVLLDAHSDGFGVMRLYEDLKQQLPDLAVIVYQCRNYSDVARIKGPVADALVKYTTPRSDKYSAPEKQPAIISRRRSKPNNRDSTYSQFCETIVRNFSKYGFGTVMSLPGDSVKYL